MAEINSNLKLTFDLRNLEKGLAEITDVEFLSTYLSFAIETDFLSQLGKNMNFILNSFSSSSVHKIKSILSPKIMYYSF